MTDDKDEEAKEGEVVESKETPLREIPVPPGGIVKSALLANIRYQMIKTSYYSYNAAIRARADSNQALKALDDSFVEGFRGAGRLADVARILEDDQIERETNSILIDAKLEDAKTELREAETRGMEAELAVDDKRKAIEDRRMRAEDRRMEADDRRRQTEHQAEMNVFKRELEMANLKVQHAEMMAGGVSNRTQTQEEFSEALCAEHSNGLMAIAEEDIQSKGLTGEEADKFRAAAQKMIEDY